MTAVNQDAREAARKKQINSLRAGKCSSTSLKYSATPFKKTSRFGRIPTFWCWHSLADTAVPGPGRTGIRRHSIYIRLLLVTTMIWLGPSPQPNTILESVRFKFK